MKCLPLDFSDLSYRVMPFSFWSTSCINTYPDLQAAGFHLNGETKSKEWSWYTDREKAAVTWPWWCLISWFLLLPGQHYLCPSSLITWAYKFFFWLNRFPVTRNQTALKWKWSDDNYQIVYLSMNLSYPSSNPTVDYYKRFYSWYRSSKKIWHCNYWKWSTLIFVVWNGIIH